MWFVCRWDSYSVLMWNWCQIFIIYLCRGKIGISGQINKNANNNKRTENANGTSHPFTQLQTPLQTRNGTGWVRRWARIVLGSSNLFTDSDHLTSAGKLNKSFLSHFVFTSAAWPTRMNEPPCVLLVKKPKSYKRFVHIDRYVHERHTTRLERPRLAPTDRRVCKAHSSEWIKSPLSLTFSFLFFFFFNVLTGNTINKKSSVAFILVAFIHSQKKNQFLHIGG